MTTERRQSRQNGSKKAPAREAEKENGGRSVGVVRLVEYFEIQLFKLKLNSKF